MKNKIALSLLFFFLLISSNYYHSITIKSYNFCSSNGEFTYTLLPNKGRNEHMMKMAFDQWKKENKQRGEQALFRGFEKEYAKFWKWYEYATSTYYQYPCKKCNKN
ncbi:MAG: hypothetical protein AAF960_05630 [Bacteroidota bacterium]